MRKYLSCFIAIIIVLSTFTSTGVLASSIPEHTTAQNDALEAHVEPDAFSDDAFVADTWLDEAFFDDTYVADVAEPLQDASLNAPTAGLDDAYVSETWQDENFVAQTDSLDDAYASETWQDENFVAQTDSLDDAYASETWENEDFVAQTDSLDDAYASETWENEDFVAQTDSLDDALDDAYVSETWENDSFYALEADLDDENVDDFPTDEVDAGTDAYTADTDVVDSEDFEEPAALAAATLTISPSSNWTGISASGGTRTITVTTNLGSNYTVNRPSWFNETTFISGGFRLNVPANNTASVRTGTVNVTGGGITRSFTVSQNAKSPSLTISPSSNWTGISASGGTRTVTVTTNLPKYTVFRPSWMNPTEFISGGFRLTAPANGGSARTGTVRVVGDGEVIERSFTVSQNAGSPSLTISPSSNWTGIAASGGTRTVTVTTNLPKYTVFRPSWMNPTEFVSGGFKLSAPANTGAVRTGTVRVVGDGEVIERSFTVSQNAGSPTLTISPSSNWTGIAASGGTRTVTVTTNLPKYTVFRPTWMNPTEFISGGFKLSAPANTGAVRTGTVRVVGDGEVIERSFTVSQNAGSPTLTISPSSNWAGIAASGSTRTVTVTTNLPKYTVFRPTWMNPTEFISGGFKLSAPANTGAVRTGTVRVVGEGEVIERSFTVSQNAGTPTLTISPSTNWDNIPASGGTRNITVTTNLGKYTVNRPTWFEPSEFVTGGFILKVPANTTQSVRSGTVKVFDENELITRSFTVTQLAGSVTPVLTISPSTDWNNVPGAGGTRDIAVTTNLKYTVYRPTWFEPTQFTSSGFTLRVPANVTQASRTGTVRVVDENELITRSFNVTQLAGSSAPILTIFPTTDWNDIPASGGTRTITVTTNLPKYTVNRPSWFEPTEFPAGGGSFILKVPANTSGAARTGTVNVTDENKTISRSFSVTQLAGSSSGQYTATVKSYYDDGYVVNGGTASKITGYQNVVKRIYGELGLQITFQTPQSYRTPADIWKGTVTSSNLDTLHQVTYPQAETDRPKLITAAKNSFSGSSTTTIAIWSANRIRSETGGKYYYNRSCSSGTHIFMLAREGDNETTGVLVHEMAHQYGASDHYHEDLGGGVCVGGIYCSTCGTSPRPSWCLMVNSRPANISQKSADSLFCSGCKRDIQSHLASHH